MVSDILAPEVGIDADTVREVVAECRRTGARLSDTLVSFGLVDRARLRECMLVWTKRKIDAILSFANPELLFVPRRRRYSEDLREERVEDAIVITDTRFHLVRFIAAAPDCFVYLVVDAGRALIAAARLGLRRAVGG